MTLYLISDSGLELAWRLRPTQATRNWIRKLQWPLWRCCFQGLIMGQRENDYKTMVSCEKWLSDLAGGTTWVDEMKSYDAKMQENAPISTSLFWFSISKDGYDSLICILELFVLRFSCWVRKQPTNRVIWALDEQLNMKNTHHKALLPKSYVGIGTSYRIPKTGPIYDNKWMLRNATVMHTVPSKCNFDKKPFVGTKMSEFSQTSASFLGVRAQKILLDIKMAQLLTTDGTYLK